MTNKISMIIETGPKTEQPLDCRSETGITVGIVDGIITFCHLLRDRDLSKPEVREALVDLTWSEGFDDLMDFLITLYDKEGLHN